jgi:hypothetical protein
MTKHQSAAEAILADANPPSSPALEAELILSTAGMHAVVRDDATVAARYPYRSDGWSRFEAAFGLLGTEREQFEADEIARLALLIPGWSVRLVVGDAFVCDWGGQ